MHKGGVLLRKEIVAAVQNSGWNNAFIFVSLRRTKVCTPRAGGASKGKPVKVRNCARSCELLNGPVINAIALVREGAAPGAVRRPALSSLT